MSFGCVSCKFHVVSCRFMRTLSTSDDSRRARGVGEVPRGVRDSLRGDFTERDSTDPWRKDTIEPDRCRAGANDEPTLPNEGGAMRVEKRDARLDSCTADIEDVFSWGIGRESRGNRGGIERESRGNQEPRITRLGNRRSEEV